MNEKIYSRPSETVEEKESIETSLHKVGEIFQKYPHPLEWSTFFEVIEDKVISTNFFPEAVEKQQVEFEDIKKAEQCIQEDINYLKNVKKALEENKEYKNSYKNMLIRKINEWVIGLYFLQNAIWIEAEKWGYELNEETKQQKHHRVQFLSSALYWPEISRTPNEVNAVKSKINKDFSKGFQNLSESEQEEFNKFFSEFFGEEMTDSISESEENSDNLQQSRQEQKQQKINSNTLKQIFEKAAQIHWIYDEIELRDDKNYIDIWENWNYIPSGKNYTLDRATKLLDHEILTHLVRSKNHPLPLRGAGYINTEEWLAILNERLVDNNLENLSDEVSLGFVLIFASENLDYENLYRFIYLYNKILWKATSDKAIQQTIRRRKRYHPYNKKWANRKDIVYTRWFRSLLEQLNNQTNEENQELLDFLNKWKFSTKDQELVEEEDNDKFIQPLWIGKIIDMKLSGEQVFFKDLEKKDQRFRSSQEVNFYTKRKIIEILQDINNNKE